MSDISGDEGPGSPEVPFQSPEDGNYSCSRRRARFMSNSDSENEEGVGSEADDDFDDGPSKHPRRILGDVGNTSTPKRPHPSIDTSNALKETNKLLTAVLERMDKQEKKIELIEKKLNTSVSSSSPSTPVRNRQKEVPLQVRRETRRVYAILEEDDSQNFKGWSIGENYTYKSPENQRVLSRLIDEVRGLNPEFVTQHIRDAAYRFFRSRVEERSVAKRGLKSDKQKQKRRHERLTRKMMDRLASLKLQKFKKPSDLSLWEQLMKTEYMSSEESDVDGEEDVLVVHDLPWRKPSVKRMFSTLDSESAKKKTPPQSRRQMKRRVVGGVSTRPKPASIPKWAANTN